MNSDSKTPPIGNPDKKDESSPTAQPTYPIQETSASNAGTAIGGDVHGNIQTTFVQIDAEDIIKSKSMGHKIKNLIIGGFLAVLFALISYAFIVPLIQGSDIEATIDVVDEGTNGSDLFSNYAIINPPSEWLSFEITNKGKDAIMLYGIPNFVVNINNRGVRKSYPLSPLYWEVESCLNAYDPWGEVIYANCREDLELEPQHTVKGKFHVDYLGSDIYLGKICDIRLSPDDVSFEIEGRSSAGNYSAIKKGLSFKNPLYWELGRYENDILKYKEDLIIDPNSLETYHDMGWAYYMLGEYNDSIAAYDKAVELVNEGDPYYKNCTISEYWFLKGIVLKDMHNYQDALKLFNDVISVDDYCWEPPGFDGGSLSEQVWYNKGVVLSRMERHEEALEAYDEGEGVGELVHKKKSESLLALGRNIEANRELAEYDEYECIPEIKYKWLY